MPTGFPEFYGTACPKCGEPIRIYPRPPQPGVKKYSLELDWSEWRIHMREKHPS